MDKTLLASMLVLLYDGATKLRMKSWYLLCFSLLVMRVHLDHQFDLYNINYIIEKLYY
jgi:hypothetical protein